MVFINKVINVFYKLIYKESYVKCYNNQNSKIAKDEYVLSSVFSNKDVYKCVYNILDK